MSFFKLLVVIHETMLSAEDILVLHQSADFLASYHALIKLSGDICYFVESTAKAYAAAQSVFIYNDKKEEINGSVDDFAYHIALETPNDGINDQSSYIHSGYNNSQYQSLAWLIARTGVSLDRVVTHAEVDKSGNHIDPRSFDMNRLLTLVCQHPRVRQIDFGILNYI